MGAQRATHAGIGDVEPFAPVGFVVIDDVVVTHHQIDQMLLDLGLALVMAIDGHGRNTQLLGQLAHREAGQSIAVDEL